MQELKFDLFVMLDLHEAHRRTRYRFGDGSGIDRVVLVRFDVRLDELRRNDPHIMTQRDELPRQARRSRTSLNPDANGGVVDEECGDPTAIEFGLLSGVPAATSPIKRNQLLPKSMP